MQAINHSTHLDVPAGARSLWILLSGFAAMFGWLSGASLGVAFGAWGLLALPCVLGLIVHALEFEDADQIEIAAWTLSATVACALTGAANSGLTILFALGPITALSMGRPKLAVEAGVFSLLGLCASYLLKEFGFSSDMSSSLGALPSLTGLAAIALIIALMREMPIASGLGEWAQNMRERITAEVKADAQRSNFTFRSEAPSTASDNAELLQRVSVAEQDAARARQALESRTRFFAQTSHELRTPLNAILGFSELMKEEMFGPLSEKYVEYANLIHEGGKSLNLITDDLLDLAKIETGKYEIKPDRMSLTDSANEAVHFMTDQAARKNIELVLVKDEDVEAIADTKAVRQIALNLISNAIKFTPEYGRVTVATRAAKGGAVLCVRDTGPGITQEQFEKITQPFVQGDDTHKRKTPKGTGLGLSVAKAFAELHSGRLYLEHAAGEGAVVCAFFPDCPPGEDG